LGVLLHELAHRLQFEAVPWSRPYLQGLLDSYLDDTSFDAERVKQVTARIVELVRDPGMLGNPKALLQLVLTPEQAVTITRAQSLMTLFEGHGNVVMEWGAELAGGELDPARVRTALAARRSRPTDKALRSLLGLSMKAEQYRVGEAWILEVAERHGREVFDRVWSSPMAVPTEAELEDSEAWVARVTA
jgi:putative hydrolase